MAALATRPQRSDPVGMGNFRWPVARYRHSGDCSAREAYSDHLSSLILFGFQDVKERSDTSESRCKYTHFIWIFKICQYAEIQQSNKLYYHQIASARKCKKI